MVWQKGVIPVGAKPFCKGNPGRPHGALSHKTVAVLQLKEKIDKILIEPEIQAEIISQFRIGIKKDAFEMLRIISALFAQYTPKVTASQTNADGSHVSISGQALQSIGERMIQVAQDKLKSDANIQPVVVSMENNAQESEKH